MAPPAAILLPLVWVGFLCGALVAALADVLPVRLPFVRPDNLFVCLTEIQVFFALFAWPLFLPSVAGKGEIRPVLCRVAALVILGAPVGLVCANVSGAGAASFLRAQALVAALAALVGAIHVAGFRRGWRVGPWYVLGAFVVSAGLPFLAFLVYEFRQKESLPWIASLSPFWGGLRIGGAGALVQAAAWGALAGALFAAARVFRKEPAS